MCHGGAHIVGVGNSEVDDFSDRRAADFDLAFAVSDDTTACARDRPLRGRGADCAVFERIAVLPFS